MKSILTLIGLLLKIVALVILGIVTGTLIFITGLFKHGATINIRKYEKRPSRRRAALSKFCHGVMWFFNLFLHPLMALMLWIVGLGNKPEEKKEGLDMGLEP